MRLLLDTHAVIWYSLSSKQLPESVLNLINEPANEVYLSQGSIWEMQIKQDLGKLTLPISVRELVEQQVQKNSFRILGIKNEHFWALAALPSLHGDPFDRLLISQAIVENYTLVTRDKKIPKYQVATIW